MAGKYDKGKDVLVTDLGTHQIGGDTKIKAGLYRYNGGAMKLGIYRVRVYKNELEERPIGRLSREEAIDLAEVLRELANEDSFWSEG